MDIGRHQMPDVIIIKTRTFGTRIYWPLLYIETELKGTAQFGLFYWKWRRLHLGEEYFTWKSIFFFKGGSLKAACGVIGACWKIFSNKICCNFGYVHKIAFCTAVQNLSQIGQRWFFTFSWGPPFANSLDFLVLLFHEWLTKNPKGGPHEKVKNQGCLIWLKFGTAVQNAILCT